MFPNFFLATLMTAIILWTGTFLHDMHYVAKKGQFTEFSSVESSFSGFHSSNGHDCARDFHVHDAVLTSRFNQVTEQISPSQLGAFICLFFSERYSHIQEANKKRGPPVCEIAFVRPVKIFLAKRSLLI